MTFGLLLLFPLASADITTGFTLSNGGFNTDPQSADLSLVWGFSTGTGYDINDLLSASVEVSREDLTGNFINSRLSYTGTHVLISAGPSFAFLNNGESRIKPAINSSAAVRKEGLFCLSASYFSTIGGLSDRDSDYTQSQVNVSLSLNIPGAICTFSFENSQFSRYGDYSNYLSLTKDGRSVYQMEADLYRKNIPFNLLISLGYKSNRRVFPSDDADSRDTAAYGHIFVGAGTIVRIGKKFELKALMDYSLYSFSLSGDLPADIIPDFLFKVETEFIYKF